MSSPSSSEQPLGQGLENGHTEGFAVKDDTQDLDWDGAGMDAEMNGKEQGATSSSATKGNAKTRSEAVPSRMSDTAHEGLRGSEDEGPRLGQSPNGKVNDRQDDEDDEEDLVVMSNEDTVLHEGGYQQVGTQSAQEPIQTKASDATYKALMRRIAINLLLIASWFLFSTLMNVYNSWFFSEKRKKFAYPLFVTSIHMTVQFAFSSGTMYFCSKNRKIVPRRRNGKRARPTRRDWATKVLPCALATAFDIGLSNLSLKTITLSFYTMCKSSNLAFVLVFAFLFGLEKMRLSLIGIIAIITVGVVMMVAAETEFVLEGAVEVLTASALGGLRWALMQILLCRRSMGMDNPIATMFWLSPLMAFFMLCGSFVIEDWRNMFSGEFFINTGTSVQTICFMILPGFIVILMTLSEFALIMRTSVMTLSVAGIFKEILTILLSIAIFGDELTPINVTGLCIALSGIALYNYLKWRLMVNNAKTNGKTRFTPRRRQSLARTSADDEDDDDWSEDEEETRMIRGHESDGRYTEMGGRPVAASSALGTAASTKEEQSVDSTDVAAMSEAERRRQRKVEEAADLPGWESSGTKRTGNGYFDVASDEDAM